MDPELEAVVGMPIHNGTPEEACQVFFYGDYHYCGEAGVGFVQCCLGGLN